MELKDVLGELIAAGMDRMISDFRAGFSTKNLLQTETVE